MHVELLVQGMTCTACAAKVQGRLNAIENVSATVNIPAGLAAQCVAWERAGRTVVLAGWDGQARRAVAVADTVKSSAAVAVAALRGLGLRTILLTGDNQATADAVAWWPTACGCAGSACLPPGLAPRLRPALVREEQSGDGTRTREHTASCLE
jgi:cation transport ATPase